jgi:Phycobilisome protein
MDLQIANLFDEAETHYLAANELQVLGQYVDSLPARLYAYRTLRDRELEIMQAVADQLQVELPQETIENLERAIKNALLSLRCCAMGMLLNNETFVKDRLNSWFSGTMEAYNQQTIATINRSLYRLLMQQLSAVLEPQPAKLLLPYLVQAQSLMQEQTPASVR